MCVCIHMYMASSHLCLVLQPFPPLEAAPGRGLGRHPRPGALRGGHQALRAEARLRGGADAGHNRLRW